MNLGADLHSSAVLYSCHCTDIVLPEKALLGKYWIVLLGSKAARQTHCSCRIIAV